MTEAENDAQPLFESGGIEQRPESIRDPYEVLDELMVVVEALCPTWPERDTFKGDDQFLL